MSIHRVSVFCSVLSATTACSGSSGPTAGQIGPGGFQSGAIGAASATIEDGMALGQLSAGDGGATYQIEIDPDRGPSVAAELMEDTPALTAPASGSATMTGGFGLLHLDNARQVGGVWEGDITETTGNLTLTANFGAATLTGGGDGLTVDGVITDSTLSGLVSHSGVNAELDGVIGSGSALGVFFGGGAGRGMAGAFAVSAQ